MDSRSGPEVPSKVHGFREAVKGWLGKPEGLAGQLLASGLFAVGLGSCSPDLHEVEGALGVLAQACAGNDARALYPAIDERARHALDAIAGARAAARTLIDESYPPEARSAALAQLGDAAAVRDGAALFAARCGADCLAALCAGVGAPVSSQFDAGLLQVKTVRGGQYVLFRAPDGRYGLVFHAEALGRERARAFAELSVIKTNAKVYREQKSLEQKSLQ
jgi:hypothetical protein